MNYEQQKQLIANSLSYTEILESTKTSRYPAKDDIVGFSKKVKELMNSNNQQRKDDGYSLSDVIELLKKKEYKKAGQSLMSLDTGARDYMDPFICKETLLKMGFTPLHF